MQNLVLNPYQKCTFSPLKKILWAGLKICVLPSLLIPGGFGGRSPPRDVYDTTTMPRRRRVNVSLGHTNKKEKDWPN